MSKKRRRYSAKEKMAALRKHFVEDVPVSDICDELDICQTTIRNTGDDN